MFETMHMLCLFFPYTKQNQGVVFLCGATPRILLGQPSYGIQKGAKGSPYALFYGELGTVQKQCYFQKSAPMTSGGMDKGQEASDNQEGARGQAPHM